MPSALTAEPQADPPSRVTPVPIIQLRDEMKRHYRMAGRHPSTYGYIRHVLNILVEMPTVRTTADIDEDAIRWFMERQPVSTLRRKVVALGAVIGFAIKQGFLQESPVFPRLLNPVESGLVAIATEGLSPKTYRSAYNAFARFLGAGSAEDALQELFDMSPDHAFNVVEAFRDAESARGLKSGSVAGKICALNHAVQKARLAGLTTLDIHVSGTPSPYHHFGPHYSVAEALEAFKKEVIAEYLRTASAGMGEARGKAEALAAEADTGSSGRSWSDLVVLGGPDDPPIVLGNPKPVLSKVRRRLIEALLGAGRFGLSLADLERACGSPRKVLKAMRDSDPDWRKVIQFPGDRAGGGYKIDFPG